ncbi:MAG: CpsD/CapB family tyrosine-protein kinase [Steroidobacteraceae bacterium]
MSVDTADETLVNEEEAEVRDALIAYCRLAPETVERIAAAMRESHESFRDAAVRTGLITPREATEAYAWARATLAHRHSSIIETALHRQSRSVTIRHQLHGHLCSRLLAATDPNHPHGEQIRALRTELLLLNDSTHRTNCFAIVSPAHRDGRSQLAAELAIGFAQLGRSTLLIDADLRSPSQHLLFGTEPEWGLAQSLSTGEQPHLIGIEGLPFLTVLPSGPRAFNPLELICGGRLERLIGQARRDYAFIIIDTPSVSQYSDALTIAALAGRVLVVSRTRSTRYKDMKTMLNRLGPTQTQILGAVANSF